MWRVTRALLVRSNWIREWLRADRSIRWRGERACRLPPLPPRARAASAVLPRAPGTPFSASGLALFLGRGGILHPGGPRPAASWIADSPLQHFERSSSVGNGLSGAGLEALGVDANCNSYGHAWSGSLCSSRDFPLGRAGRQPGGGHRLDNFDRALSRLLHREFIRTAGLGSGGIHLLGHSRLFGRTAMANRAVVLSGRTQQGNRNFGSLGLMAVPPRTRPQKHGDSWRPSSSATRRALPRDPSVAGRWLAALASGCSPRLLVCLSLAPDR